MASLPQLLSRNPTLTFDKLNPEYRADHALSEFVLDATKIKSRKSQPAGGSNNITAFEPAATIIA
ncbi:hypothetical protein LTR09_011720 [Extremus antarcticus]|uniref:Uncharacterized protein n=1 Tax=Extremus antarcticus TaxID=702011 RepID=A0AAJ0D672_9PEZI|nr:hypothetical protein LTR09_011720 [Extremus antarcticus]